MKSRCGAAVLVVDGFLQQRSADSLRDTALGLALDGGGIEPGTAVVGDPVLQDSSPARSRCRLDQHQMTRVGRRR